MQLGIRYMRITEHLAKAVIPFLPLFSFSQLKINQERYLYTTNRSLFVLFWFFYRVPSAWRSLLIYFSASLNHWGVSANTSSCHSFLAELIVSLSLCLHTETSNIAMKGFPQVSSILFVYFGLHTCIFFQFLTTVVALSKWKTAQPPCTEFPRTSWFPG